MRASILSWRWPPALLLLGAAASVGIMALPRVGAALSAEAASAGLSLLEQLGPSDGRPYVARLNGQRLLLSSRVTTLSVSAVLDAFERGCQSPGASPTDAADPERWLTVRHGDAAASIGQSACFSDPAGRRVAERIWGLLRDGDLSRLGQARYVLARRVPGSSDTHVLEMSVPDGLSLSMLLGGAYASASDDRGLPPPPAATPLLDARVEGEPSAVQIYVSQEPPLALLERYSSVLCAAGFEPLPPSAADADASDRGTTDGAALRRAFVSVDRALLVSVRPSAGETLLSRVAIARPGAALDTGSDARSARPHGG